MYREYYKINQYCIYGANIFNRNVITPYTFFLFLCFSHVPFILVNQFLSRYLLPPLVDTIKALAKVPFRVKSIIEQNDDRLFFIRIVINAAI